jgi:hypothetical protein
MLKLIGKFRCQSKENSEFCAIGCPETVYAGEGCQQMVARKGMVQITAEDKEER